MKNKIPTHKLESWISSLLEEFDADELFKMLSNQCDAKQKSYLIDAMKHELIYENIYPIECKTLNDKIKFESFIEDFKPYYNEQTLLMY